MIKGEELLEAFKLLPPLFGLAMVAALVARLSQWKKLYIGGGLLHKFANFMIASSVAAMLAVASATCLYLVMPEAPPMASLGVLIFSAVFGVRGIDALLFRVFGIRLSDRKDADSAKHGE